MAAEKCRHCNGNRDFPGAVLLGLGEEQSGVAAGGVQVECSRMQVECSG